MKAINIIKTIRTSLFPTKSLVISILLCWLFPNSVWAYDAYVNGIYYNLNTTDKTASVTGGPDMGDLYSGQLAIQESFYYDNDLYSVTSIGARAFAYCTGLTSVIIPNSVTSIGEDAFYLCEYLTSVDIPNSVTIIGEGAFYRCMGLTSIDIPNSVTSICEATFKGCSELTSVNIPNSVTSIGGYAFYYCSRLTSIDIPNSVTSIGEDAFMDCTSLTSVNIPNSVTSIGAGAFFRCTGLTSIDIPNSVTSIVEDTFSGCTSLTSVNIPNSVTSIGAWSFEDCISLTSVNIPSSVNNIGQDPFLDCTGLISIYVDANNATYDSRENCNAIIETSTNTIILGCKNTVIPNSVTSIDRSAFCSCTGLTSLIIPNSVTSIDERAFIGCKSLTSITVEWTTPLAISSHTFWGVDKSNCTLYVPAGTKTAYENAQYWNEFGTIVEMENVEDPDTDLSVYDNVVYIEGAEAFVGQQIRLSLKMNNTIEATGFQCDVYLPDGVTAAQDEDGFYLMDISEERTTAMKTDYSASVMQPDGGLRFMCSSTNSYTFSGSEGEVAYLMVEIDPNMEEGTYPLILRNVEISDANSNPYRVSYVKTTLTVYTYTLGDANNDGSIGVSDFTAIANYIMGTPPASFIKKAADVNVDDVISVSDLTGVANLILYGTVTPNATHAKTRNDVADKYANVGANDVVATTDKEFTVAVNINGNFAYSGYQFDMTLPEGMSVKNVEGQTKASDVFMSGMIDDNTLRVLCASTVGETTENTVVNLTLVADVEGTYRIDIDNAIVSANASTYTMSNSSFLVGIGNDATGISTLDDESGSNAAVYDLTGKKLIGNGNMSSLQKGIYIINGKKVTK